MGGRNPVIVLDPVAKRRGSQSPANRFFQDFAGKQRLEFFLKGQSLGMECYGNP